MAQDPCRVDACPADEEAKEDDDERPGAAELAHGVGYPLPDGQPLLHLLVGIADSQAREHLVGAAQALRDDTQEMPRRGGILINQLRNGLARDADKLDFVGGTGGRVARLAVEEPQLAEERAGAEGGEHDLFPFGWEHDVHTPFFHDIEPVGRISLLEDDLPAVDDQALRGARERGELFLGQVAQQGDPVESVVIRHGSLLSSIIHELPSLIESRQ